MAINLNRPKTVRDALPKRGNVDPFTVKVGMLVGDYYRAGLSKAEAHATLIKANGFTADAATEAIDRWVRNQKFTGKTPTWSDQ